MSLDALLDAGLLLVLPAALLGWGAGVLHVRTLRPVAEMLAAGRLRGVALQLVRFAALAAFLLAAALLGAPALIGAALGVLSGRLVAARRIEREMEAAETGGPA